MSREEVSFATLDWLLMLIASGSICGWNAFVNAYTSFHFFPSTAPLRILIEEVLNYYRLLAFVGLPIVPLV